MTDGEAWLEALGEQLRESAKQIPALAAAQAKLADADVAGVGELQQEAAAWHACITSAARAVLGARLSRAAPVMANAVAWASKLQDELSRLGGIMEAEGAPSASSGATDAEGAPASSEASSSRLRSGWAGVGAALAEAGERASDVAAAKELVGKRLGVGTAIVAEAAGFLGEAPEALLTGTIASQLRQLVVQAQLQAESQAREKLRKESGCDCIWYP